MTPSKKPSTSKLDPTKTKRFLFQKSRPDVDRLYVEELRLKSKIISIFLPGRVVLGGNCQSLTLPCCLVDYLTYIYQLLLVPENPVDFVVIACP